MHEGTGSTAVLTVRLATEEHRRGVLLRVMWQLNGRGVRVVGPIIVRQAGEVEDAVLGALRELSDELHPSYFSD
jgi:hypothetical protein